jgi:hypothetical protein
MKSRDELVFNHALRIEGENATLCQAGHDVWMLGANTPSRHGGQFQKIRIDPWLHAFLRVFPLDSGFLSDMPNHLRQGEGIYLLYTPWRVMGQFKRGGLRRQSADDED